MKKYNITACFNCNTNEHIVVQCKDILGIGQNTRLRIICTSIFCEFSTPWAKTFYDAIILWEELNEKIRNCSIPMESKHNQETKIL